MNAMIGFLFDAAAKLLECVDMSPHQNPLWRRVEFGDKMDPVQQRGEIVWFFHFGFNYLHSETLWPAHNDWAGLPFILVGVYRTQQPTVLNPVKQNVTLNGSASLVRIGVEFADNVKAGIRHKFHNFRR